MSSIYIFTYLNWDYCFIFLFTMFIFVSLYWTLYSPIAAYFNDTNNHMER